MICLLPVDKQTTEIKNIAISPAYQGKGLGSWILKKAEEITRKGGYITIIVGTADCGTKQIQFYEKRPLKNGADNNSLPFQDHFCLKKGNY